MFYLKLLFALLLFPAYLCAQDHYAFQHLSIDDGLLSNQKMNVYQDSEGYYWFSAVAGLQRFDGKNFINYKYNYGTKNVAEEKGGKPLEDKEKNIWVVNPKGINIFYRKEQRLQRLYVNDAPDSNNSNIVCIAKDKSDNIRIVTKKNIYSYDYKSAKTALYSKIISDANPGISIAEYDPGKNIFWFIISNEIEYFDCNNKQLYQPVNNNVKQLLGHDNPIALFRLDGDGNLWIANYLGDFCKYNTATGISTSFSILHDRNNQKTGSPNSSIIDFLDDGNGTIWFATDNYTGLLKYNKATGSFIKIQHENGSEYGLHYDQNIFSFYEDREKNIWVNTDLGMNVFNPHLQQFKYLSHQTNSSISQFSADVTSISQNSKNDIWITTWGDGVFDYDSNFVLHKIYINHIADKTSFGEPFNRAWNTLEDETGKIWIGCQYGMLSILDTATGKFINKVIPEFEHSTIMKMVIDKKNNIWCGLFNGTIAKINFNNGIISVYKNLQHASPFDGLCVDRKNNLWIGTSSGLYELDNNNNISGEPELSNLHIFSPQPMNDSMIVGGTSGKGLFMFNYITKTTKFLNTTNGLSSDIVYGAVGDDSRSGWLIADNGIERLNLSSGKISSYDINDGIRDHVFQNAFCKLKNGTILIAANSGIIYFNPDNIKEKAAPPDVLITNFSLDEKSLSVDSLLQNKKINLPYDQNVLTIGYASVSFIGRNTDQYFYELEGIDKNWVSAGQRRSVTYANIAPGNYIFKVRSQNRDGAGTDHITQLNIAIHPPWWQTWWAYLLWFIIAVSILYAIYDYRKSSRRALSEMRQRIANDLHDDIGSTLNSISVYSEIAGKQLQNNPENSKNLLEKMGNSSRNMIDTMNDIVWAINPKNDQFESILQRMQYFAGELLSGKNMFLQFDVDEMVKSIKLPMAKRKNFYLIFKEAVNNAYKYSNAKTVNISIAQEANHLITIITDDGVGFDSAKINVTGNGLKNMQARAKEIGAQLSIKSWQKKGTRIELQMPVR